MEKNIGVGLIIGLVAATSLYVWNSENFTKTQKTILLVFILFPPLQWISILIVLLYNNQQSTFNSFNRERVASPKKESSDSLIENLQRLKESGIITTEEYDSKLKQIIDKDFDQNVKNSTEYLQLKKLYDTGVFNKVEFESKVEIIKNKLKSRATSVDYLPIHIISNPPGAIIKDENTNVIGITPATINKKKYYNTEIKLYSGTKFKRFLIDDYTKDIDFDFEKKSEPIVEPSPKVITAPPKKFDNSWLIAICVCLLFIFVLFLFGAF
jgi:hypothetical protein